jgi:rhodanese-related sulfurtransferase
MTAAVLQKTPPNAIGAHTLKRWLHDGQELALFDVRERGPFAESHLLFAIPLPYSRLELDAPRLAPRRSVRTVVCDADGKGAAVQAARRLEALGYRDVYLLEGGTAAWAAAGYGLFAGVNVPSKTFGELAELAYGTPHIGATELARRVAAGEPLAILDGRPMTEFRKMSIPGGRCCPNGELPYRVTSLVPDPRTTVVINCAGRTRSIIGAQTLINLGLPNPVLALENGTQGWTLNELALDHGRDLGYPPDSGSTALREAALRLAAAHGVQMVAPETVSAWARDGARTLYLCDVRSPEEFAAGSLPGAQHTPGGQLIQSTDEYIGVRHARLVLFDDDGVRAPTVASWLRQLGHDAHVLDGGLRSGLALHTAPVVELPLAPPEVAPSEVAEALRDGKVQVVDLRPSALFRQSRIPGAVWSIRPRMRALADASDGRPLVLVAEHPSMAALAASELGASAQRLSLLRGGFESWAAAGLPVDTAPLAASQDEHIDFVFFVHDRHDGNKEAARRYLAWEIGLVAQLDPQERAMFRLPGDGSGSPAAGKGSAP